MRTATRTAVSTTVCLLAILPTACGSTTPKPASDARAQVSQAVYTYLHAQSQGDGATACGVLTASGQAELGAIVVKDGQGLVTSRPACPDAVGLVHTFAGAKLLSALGSAHVEKVRVNGSMATAEVIDGTAFHPQQVRLDKSAGQWKIAAVPGLGG